ncbi:GIY-YIG nuclease family protein [Bacillus toyonensis]|uniref:GIY-YIG nuclease family protein n=1 Tax=Bacillus toyonensis TaxID=155322 RepID=UPI0009A5E746|nr:GIY-YIG nuclease family protein [Bacillus toyonensis]SLK12271.1 hypothetical protein SAMN05880553_3712 [Bacillus toyonensis]
MKRIITISGLNHTDPISKQDEHDSDTINIEDEEVIAWDNLTLFDDLPEKHGVYMIYDHTDAVIYVGKTWKENGFYGRFYRHMTDSDGYFPYWQYTAKNIRLYYINKRLEMLTLERLKIQQHEPSFNKEDVGSAPSDGQRKKIKKELQGQLDVIKDMFYDNPIASDEYLKLLMVTAGFHKVDEWIIKEGSTPGYLEERFYEIDKPLKETNKLLTTSKKYSRGLYKLISD